MDFMSSLQNGFDDQKPSIFELLSEQQLSSLIPPSLRYLLALATHRHPRYLLRLLNSFDEVYALLMLAVERQYLLTYGGGFTENFYGLKRERVLRIKGGEAPRAQIAVPSLMRETLKLTSSDVWRNLAIMVGLPYIRRKLDESYDIHAPQVTILGPSYNRDTLPPDATLRQRILYYYKWFLRNIYPSVNAAYYFSLLAFNLAYLFDNTKYSSPFLWLIGTRIRRLGGADHRAIALALQPHPTPPTTGARPGQNTSILNPRTLATIVYPRLLSSLKLLLPTSIFALKFLEWWHASDFSRQLSRKAAEGLDLPPPIIPGLPSSPGLSKPPASASTSNPTTTKSTTTNTVSLSNPPPTQHPNSTKPRRKPPTSSTTLLPILTVPPPSPLTTSLCPICLHPIQTPTAAQTGYVFCYACIFKWVDGSHERQLAFMDGSSGGDEGWGEDEDDAEDDDEEEEAGDARIGERGSGSGVNVDGDGDGDGATTGGDNHNRKKEKGRKSRQGRWESGKGRCAVTGRKVLGGTDGLRRVMV
ncbi:ubiquitin-protein ligase peroxin 12 [Lignoscripta atroalba]|nr:ubiquitin-protein ligase peroxin 12 [Lignoscripta atroalba]